MARMPGRCASFSSRRPYRTKIRFSPRSGAISAIVNEILIAAERARQRESELECDADRGQILVARRASWTLRIENRERRRKRATRQVMVGDDDVDARRLKRSDRAVRTGSAVARDHQLGSRLVRGVNTRLCQVVPVLQPARNEWNGVAAERHQCADHQRRRADTINVVIAVNENRLVLSERDGNSLHGAIEIGHAARVVQLVEPRSQVRLGFPGHVIAANGQQTTDRAWQVQFLLQLLDGGRVRLGGKDPACARANAHRRRGHDGNLFVARITDNHHSVAYSITPHPSQISVVPVLSI